jgi:hypothetical protein
MFAVSANKNGNLSENEVNTAVEALVRSDLSEVHISTIIRVKTVTANVTPSSVVLFTLMMEATRSSETRLLEESHGVTFQKMAVSIVTAAKT